MEYNWADPKKNKRVDSVMMAKAEASRVKRLSTIKSTVSNQLHPAAEHKLKTMKKKKTPEQDTRPSSRLHQRECDGDDNNNNHSSGSSSSSTSFYNEFLPQAAKPPSVFDGFDVHAAADGLFHPASNIQAFAEHDAKYPARDKSSARSSSRSLSSRESERRLPPLSGNADRSERLASRSDSRLPTASSTASSAASHRSLLDSRAGVRSESELHAPRRIGIVPSSADRNAMDLLNEMDDEDDLDGSHYGQQQRDDEYEEEPQVPSPPQLKKSLVTTNRSGDNNSSKSTSSPSTVPPLELDLSQKFEQLKLLMKTNREKGGDLKAAPRPEVEHVDEYKATAKPAALVKEVKAKRATREEESMVIKVKKASKPKLVTSIVAEKKESSSKTHQSTDGDKEHATRGGEKKTKTSELKTRTGVSLSDLKQEHRAALAMLQELGGPLEAESEEHDADAQKKTKMSRVAVASKARDPKSSSTSVSVKTTTKDTAGIARSSGSADRSNRLVDKLRSQIPSGRDKIHSDGSAAHALELQGKDLIDAALDAARHALEGDASTGRVSDTHSQAKQLGGEEDDLLWKRFAGDDQDDDDDEEEDPSAELYDDEYFEG